MSDQEPTVDELANRIREIYNENFDRLRNAVDELLERFLIESGDVVISSKITSSGVKFEYGNSDQSEFFGDGSVIEGGVGTFEIPWTSINRNSKNYLVGNYFNCWEWEENPAQGFVELIRDEIKTWEDINNDGEDGEPIKWL